MDQIYGSLLRDDISRSCILLPSNSRKPIFHHFQLHLSFFHEPEEVKDWESLHDLQVDHDELAGVLVLLAGNVGPFECLGAFMTASWTGLDLLARRYHTTVDCKRGRWIFMAPTSTFRVFACDLRARSSARPPHRWWWLLYDEAIGQEREEAGKNATPFMALWYAWHPVNTETFMALILVANDKDYFACNNYMLWKISKLFFIDGVVALTF